MTRLTDHVDRLSRNGDVAAVGVDQTLVRQLQTTTTNNRSSAG